MTAPLPGLPEALARLAAGQTLTRAEARDAMASILSGQATPAQAGAFLMGLRLLGETEAILAGLVETMRSSAVRIAPRRSHLVDLCGTGGDGSGTFNISTAASFVAAGAGCAVAKHGNRSASSQCGSADVMEALRISIDLSPERANAAIEEIGFAFLFAPLYHPAMKHVAPVRKELKIRTVFNLLGPLSNPAGVEHQLIGVYDDGVRPLLARVLALLGARRVWVVHGEGGVDELSIAGASQVTEAVPPASGELRTFSVRPEDCGLPLAPLSTLRGGSATENAQIIESLLRGEKGPRRDAVVWNAGAAIHVAGVAASLREGVERAKAALDRGDALKVLDALRRFR